MSLVSSAWLAEHLDDPDVRIVDTRWYLLEPNKGERDYRDGHIPNAIYLSVDRELSAKPLPDAKTGRHPLPWPEAFSLSMAHAGISSASGDDPGSHVIAYDDAGGVNAARVWWLLKYFGHDRVSLLDGGLNHWLAEGRGLSRAAPRFPRGKFIARPNPDLVVSKEELSKLLHNPQALILDARAPERYAGHVEPVDARAGHIPRARNAPGAGNLRAPDDFRFKDPAGLRDRHDALGADDAELIVAYCGSGVNACATLFVLHLAGYENLKLYAGSFSEWSRDPELPVIEGPEPF
jgi:thiosulfate/3-mercaptopyruvate sulfurtransferase